MQLDRALSSGAATLVVMLPDALESRLVGPLEHWLRDATGCVPLARRSFRFTEPALDRFYPGLAARAADNWQLLVAVFTAGQSLATIWSGDGAAERLPAVKGQTHPAHCAASTLRGRFWCDNAVANLVHVSDGPRDAVREVGVLRGLVPGLLPDELAATALPTFRDPGAPTPRHSGILTLCRLVETLVTGQGVVLPQLELPDGGDARQTMRAAETWLRRASASATGVAHVIDSYLTGTAEPSAWVATLRDGVSVGAWEERILRCGLLSRAEWSARADPR